MYSDGFEDCLKQIATLYLNLNLSIVVIDDTVLPMLGGTNTIINEADGVVYLVEGEVKELAHAEIDGQNVPEGQTIPKGLSVPESSLAPKGQYVPNGPPT